MLILLTAFTCLAAAQSGPLTPADIVQVPGPAGKYDFIITDPSMNRIVGAHAGVGGVTILDLKTRTATELPGPKLNGVAVDEKSNRILGAGPDKMLVAYDRTTFKNLGSVPLEGPGDGCSVNPRTGKLYVCEDDGTHVWVFDPATLKKEGAVDIKGAPEWIEYDGVTNRIYQNIKTPSYLQAIDPATDKVVADWPLNEIQGPHGMAIDGANNKAFSAGKDGKLAMVDLTSGKVEAVATIAPGVDEIAYDPELRRIYCGCTGVISVVSFENGTLKPMGDVPSEPGSKSLTVDRKTHDVWLGYADKDHSYFKRFTANK